MSFPNDRTYNFDANLVLSDGAASYTTTGWAQVGGADGIVDMGGNQGTSPTQQARFSAVAVIDVTLLDATTTDESYRIIVAVSNDPAFGNGNIFAAGEIEIAGGALSVLGLGGAGVTGTGTTGRYEVMFTNNIAGSLYQYVKLFNVLTGTTPIITYEAFLAVIPEP